MDRNLSRCLSRVLMLMVALALTFPIGYAVASGVDVGPRDEPDDAERNNPRPRGRTVVLRAGSVDELAAAIAAAGYGGTVLLQSGTHFESGPVEISTPVTILGKRGAVLESATTPVAGFPVPIEAALYIRDTSDVTVKGIVLRPSGSDGNTAILIENSRGVQISGNTILDHQFGVLNQFADRTEISGNTIRVTSLWLTGEYSAHGIVNINGRSVKITENSISGGLFGIWACDRDGRLSGNTTSDAFVGLILCNVPDGDFLISGDDSGSVTPATGWTVKNNFSAANGYAGYMVTDGSTDNFLDNNAASGNGVWDLEVLGDSCLFGFLTPTAVDTVIDVGNHPNISIKDCGVNTIVNSDMVNRECEDPPPTSCP